MNRNRKLRKQMMSGLAVGMAAVMGAAPVYAATPLRIGRTIGSMPALLAASSAFSIRW